MIRINLAKTHAYATPASQTATTISDSPGRTGTHPGVKIFLMVIFVAGVIAFEKKELSGKRKALAVTQSQLQAQQAEIDKFGSVTAVIEELEKEKKKTQEQLSVIQAIAQKRVFKLDAIVKMQESVTDDLWLEELSVDKDEIFFKGFSRSPSSVQLVVKKLKESKYVLEADNIELSRDHTTPDLQKFVIRVMVKH